MMRSVVVALAANEVRELALTGNYFELRTAAEIVTKIELLDKSGGVVSHLDEADATDYVRTDRKFETVRLTNGATGQTLRFYHGEGETGSNRFTGVVSGEVSLSAASLAALESVDLNAATLNSLNRPEAATGSINSLSAPLANTPVVLVAPAANVNGLIVLTAQISSNPTTQTRSAILGKAGAAPATPIDGEPVLISRHLASTGAYTDGADLMMPVYLPAGMGLYFIADASTLNSLHLAARWKLL